MADYTPSFTAAVGATKDSTNATVQGSELGTEFDNIATAVASKLDDIAGGTNSNLVQIGSSGATLTDSGVATSALATLTGTETLTNKTINSPTIDAPTITNYGHWKLVGSTRLSSAATSISVSGLDGDTHKMYRVVAKLSAATVTGGTLDLTFNSDTGTNYSDAWQRRIVGSGGSSSTDGGAWLTNSSMQLFMPIDVVTIDLLINAESSEYRVVTGGYGFASITGGLQIVNYVFAGVWHNTANNLTDITLTTSVASNLDTDSEILVFGLVGE